MKNHHGIVLGQKYQHVRLPIKGTAVAFAHYLTGCDQVLLERMVADKIEHDWFDVTNIEGVSVTADKARGGPQVRAPAPG